MAKNPVHFRGFHSEAVGGMIGGRKTVKLTGTNFAGFDGGFTFSRIRLHLHLLAKPNHDSNGDYTDIWAFGVIMTSDPVTPPTPVQHPLTDAQGHPWMYLGLMQPFMRTHELETEERYWVQPADGPSIEINAQRAIPAGERAALWLVIANANSSGSFTSIGTYSYRVYANIVRLGP